MTPPLDKARGLGPIEQGDVRGRFYIPLPAGWEVQTKGAGSTFRIADTKTGERFAVFEERTHGEIERMAREIHEAHTALVAEVERLRGMEARYRFMREHFKPRLARHTPDYWVMEGECKTTGWWKGGDFVTLNLDDAIDAAIAAIPTAPAKEPQP